MRSEILKGYTMDKSNSLKALKAKYQTIQRAIDIARDHHAAHMAALQREATQYEVWIREQEESG